MQLILCFNRLKDEIPNFKVFEDFNNKVRTFM